MAQLSSFLGFANYYREFIKGYADIAAPLSQLNRKNATWQWGEEEQSAFDALKEILTSEPVLGLPTDEGMFILDTDASTVAIAGVLSQKQERNGQVREVPIAYASKTLKPVEQRYGAAKLEMLAAKEFIEKFKPFLVRGPFLLRTDNAGLAWLRKYSMSNPMCSRWIQKLEQYCFHVEHRKRDKHFNADGLTKQPHHFELMEKQKAQETSEVGGFTSLADPKDFEALKDVESEEGGDTATEEKNRIMSCQ